jgi:hypothetical protein
MLSRHVNQNRTFACTHGEISGYKHSPCAVLYPRTRKFLPHMLVLPRRSQNERVRFRTRESSLPQAIAILIRLQEPDRAERPHEYSYRHAIVVWRRWAAQDPGRLRDIQGFLTSRLGRGSCHSWSFRRGTCPTLRD